MENLTSIIAQSALALSFLILAIFLFRGKGSWLVAGFNTMSKKEKEQYDKLAMCRFMGKLMLAIALCVLLFIGDDIFPGHHLAAYGGVLIPVFTIAAVIYANTGNRFRKKTE